ncbi:hypothetical protein WA026_003941 [Henosepilachna vigintioctopunctata]|uniref:Uncharacterized protein n=1 Tax=Henosepilachna vigintioctopunctata TaxID=420089 RepID=A0AAW1U631_9CUCU
MPESKYTDEVELNWLAALEQTKTDVLSYRSLDEDSIIYVILYQSNHFDMLPKLVIHIDQNTADCDVHNASETVSKNLESTFLSMCVLTVP